MRATRWAVVVAALCVVVTAVAVAYAAGRAKAAPAVEVVRAKRFELVDGQGQVRAALRVSSNGTPVLEMLDAGGKHRVSLSGSDETPGLALGLEGKQRGGLALGVNAAGVPMLYLTDQTGLMRAELTTTPDGDPRLTLYDKEGHPGAELAIPARPRPGLP